MAVGGIYWISYEPAFKVSSRVWGGGLTWETQAMEVKSQLIPAPEPLNCTDRKQRERMAELQERRRSLQALLSSRLAELRRICLQEAELTGAVPSDFPLEAGEKPPCVRQRGGTSRPGNRKCRIEEDDSQRSKPKKTLFSAALKKHDSEHNTNTQTQTHHGKRTVHRGCHTDDMVRSESSSTTDSTGHDNEDNLAQCRPPLGSSGSPVQVFYPPRTRRNSLHTRAEHLETHKPLPLPPSHPPPLPLHPPPPPPRSQDSSSSDHGPVGGVGVGGVSAARRSNSSDGLLDRIAPPEEEAGGAPQGGLRVNGGPGSRGAYWNLETRAGDGEGGARGGEGRRRGRGGVAYSEVLLDYVWLKQQQLQRQQSQPNRPITSQQQFLYNGVSSSSSTNQQPSSGAPPTYHAHHADQLRVKVTRTKSCGPFLPVQQSQSEMTHNPPLSAIQPDPHPHLLPPRPPQPPPNQDSQLEDATRSLHKALALEGLRDWYLRNTLGPSQNQTNGKVPPGPFASTAANVNGGIKGGVSGGGGALQRRRTTHGVIQQPAYQTEVGPHNPAPHHKQTLPHSATFHGHPLHGRSADAHLYQDAKKEAPLREPLADQPSPGTLV
ncbi:unnamed protein product [Ophioblennius macclurei]